MQPNYFLDLVVENVKCFKERQVLDLSDGNGKPALWTIILGENGTGKTTLLRKLVQRLRLKGAPLIAYGASRRMGNGSLSETKNPDRTATLFDNEATLINAEAWLLETDFAITNAKGDTKKYLEKRYGLVKETLKKLLPDVMGFRIKKITKTQTQAAIEVKTHYSWAAMKDLSYGYLTFIGWVVDLAARMFDRYPDSEDPLAEPAIVLVDEIDLHLHPKWQRQIIEFLTKIFSQIQFIVTAHSPLIVQAAENANLVLLKREGGGVKIYNDMEKEAITGWRIDQVLASDLFGLESTRPPIYDKPIKRQKELLAKSQLTNNNENELVEIGKELEKMSLTNDISNESVKVLQKALKILQPNDQD